MTRFDADDAKERRKLVADAVAAHRERASAFLTVEVAADPDLDGTDDDGNPNPAPWIQFADATFNMDVADAERDGLDSLLNAYPEFRIDAMESPDDAEGTNVRISARSDANRLSAFVDEAFQQVYGRDENYRLWVSQV